MPEIMISAFTSKGQSLPNDQERDSTRASQPIFENTEYVTTEGAARYLSRLLGKPFTANAIRLRVHRGQLKPLKPTGERGESFFKISELRSRFTSSQQNRRK